MPCEAGATPVIPLKEMASSRTKGRLAPRPSLCLTPCCLVGQKSIPPIPAIEVGLGEPLLELLAVVVRGGLLDLRLDLPDAALILDRVGKGSCETHGKRPRI